MKVGVGVLSYNRANSLAGCLDSLFENLRCNVPVAVNCDAWNSTVEGVTARYPVTILTGHEQGISHANNRLLHFFQGTDAVFLVQDDVRFLRPEWLDQYCEAVALVPYLAFFDPYYPQHPSRPRHYHVNHLGRREAVVRQGIRLSRCHKSPQGAFQAIGRSCFEAVGYFDVGFGRYGCEHNDYWLRTCNAGISPPEHFYDVERSTELLKIDWKQPVSLQEAERDQAYAESEQWRRKLFVFTNEGFGRTRVEHQQTDVQVLRHAPNVCSDEIRTTDHDCVLRQYWIYPERVPVLAYHAIANDPDDPFALSQSLFEQHLDSLCRHLSFLTAAQAFATWRENGRFPEGAAIMTFDDGYSDILDILPLLKSYNVPVTLFVPTAWVGRTNEWDRRAYTPRRHLHWSELGEVVRQGHEVGSHSCEHVRLTQIDPSRASDELACSKGILEDRLGQPMTSMAYPFGSTNRSIAATAAKHYDVAFTTTAGSFDWGEDRHMIRRIVIRANEDARSLLSRVNDYMMQASDTAPVAWTSRPRSADRHRRPDSAAF